MPYVKSETVAEVNFLASAHFQAFTYPIDATGVTPNAQGRKIVPGGTVYPANDATAIGLVFSDIDVTEGPQPGSVMVGGWVHEARLPVAPTAEAKTAMTAIHFRQVD